MSDYEDRRHEPRKPAQRRAVVLSGGLELAAWVTDVSAGGLRLRLERSLGLDERVTVIEVHAALAHEVEIVWRKGMEAGAKRRGPGASLRGLVPHRLAALREAWRRAGGR